MKLLKSVHSIAIFSGLTILPTYSFAAEDLKPTCLQLLIGTVNVEALEHHLNRTITTTLEATASRRQSALSVRLSPLLLHRLRAFSEETGRTQKDLIEISLAIAMELSNQTSLFSPEPPSETVERLSEDELKDELLKRIVRNSRQNGLQTVWSGRIPVSSFDEFQKTRFLFRSSQQALISAILGFAFDLLRSGNSNAAELRASIQEFSESKERIGTMQLTVRISADLKAKIREIAQELNVSDIDFVKGALQHAIKLVGANEVH